MLKSKICLDNCKACFTFVASNFTIMRDYKKHLTLLPHKWQNVGFVMLAIVAVCFVPFICLRDQYESQFWYLCLYFAGDITLSISLFLVCFSQEKYEDEYIASARYRALTIVAYTFIVGWAIASMIKGGPTLGRGVISSIGQMVGEEDYYRDLMTMANTPAVLRGIFLIAAYISNLAILQLFYILLLKIIVRTGKGIGFESILLPYIYKKTGWWILIISAILIPAVLYFIGHVLPDNMGNVMERSADRQAYIRLYVTVCRIMAPIPYVGILFICLSKEKQEDEFIQHIRVRILAFFVIYYLVAMFLRKHTDFSIPTLIAMKTQGTGLRGIAFTTYSVMLRIGGLLGRLTWVPLVSVVYALVLKKVLSKNSTESSNEE